MRSRNSVFTQVGPVEPSTQVRCVVNFRFLHAFCYHYVPFSNLMALDKLSLSLAKAFMYTETDASLDGLRSSIMQ